MFSLLAFLLFCLCLGLGARRFRGRVHLFLIAGTLAMMVVTWITLLRM